MRRLLVALLGIVLFLTSCSVAPSKPHEIEYPWQVPSNTIEADGTVFAIPLNAGDRVEIEVSNATGISYLKDPFGNVVARSATKIQYYEEPNYQEKSESDSTPELPKYSPYLVSTQEYPWRFSYVAPSGGNYILSTSGINNNPAHIKVTLNP